MKEKKSNSIQKSHPSKTQVRGQKLPFYDFFEQFLGILKIEQGEKIRTKEKRKGSAKRIDIEQLIQEEKGGESSNTNSDMD